MKNNMKLNNLKFIFLRQFLALIFLVPFVSIAQTDEVTWDYPVHYGTKEWSQLNSFSERLNAFTIPDSILTKMTTENLVKTCLKYPYWILITSRDNNQTGYDYLKSVFNGFLELESRRDAGKELLRAYEKMIPEDIYKYEALVKQGVFSFQFTYIEILLSQSSILKNMGNEDLVFLVKKVSSVYKAKSEAFDKYSYYGIATSCLILLRTLELKNYHEFELMVSDFPDLITINKKGNSANKDLLDRIYLEATNLFNN